MRVEPRRRPREAGRAGALEEAMTRRRTLGALAPLMLAGCAHPPAGPPVDERAAEIMRLDAAWASALARGDAEGWRATVAEDAVFAGASLRRGRDDIWAGWKVFFGAGGPTLRWTPTAGGVAGSGDLAWTTGRARLERPGPGGKAVASDLRYVTVWARDAGGTWRVALDGPLEAPEDLGAVERVAVRSLASKDGTLDAAVGTWTQDGPSGRRQGAWLTVREKSGGAWRARFDSAVAFPPPGSP
jgi:ketosteroid isomerase-like protein